MKEKIDETEVVGMTKQDACRWLKDRGLTYRTVKEDGKNFIITMDLCFDRVNLTIEKGLITKADRG